MESRAGEGGCFEEEGHLSAGKNVQNWMETR